MRNIVLICSLFFLPAAACAGDGLESFGNADGVLTWDLGSLEPGTAASRTVLFAFAPSRDELVEQLDAEISPPTTPAWDEIKPATTADPGPVWLKNDSTDFALDPNGSFLWEGKRQALNCDRGGQLSRFGYAFRYTDSVPRDAGVSIARKDALSNLRVLNPVRTISSSHAAGRIETTDRKVRVEIHETLSGTTLAGVTFRLTNRSDQPLTDVGLSVYSNLESAHDHENDYCVLDPELFGPLFVDIPTGHCVAMVGAEQPSSGYAGVWASENQLLNGEGVPFSEWPAYEGLPDLTGALARNIIPHPPAPKVEPVEPETRALTEAEADAALEADWLFQAGEDPLLERAEKEIGWTRELIARLAPLLEPSALETERRDIQSLQNRVAPLKQGPEDLGRERELYLDVRRLKRRVAMKNPVLDFDELLFIDNPYTQGAEWPHEARHRNGMMSVPGGRLLTLKGLHPGGKIRKLGPEKPGSFWRPDLSFDAKKVVFCFKPHDEKSFHLYEIDMDGTGLKQLTYGDYDDLDPIYLPDGHIMFSTSRCNTYIRCMPYTYAYVLARCDADGENIYLVSRGNEPDWLPTLLNDGRVIYTRWEYTDKALWRIQSLWTVNQDGTNTAAYWGNQSVWPDMLIEPRPIPNSERVMFTGAAHHDWFAGSVGILDPSEGSNFPSGLTKVTADVDWPECGTPPEDPIESADYHTSGPYDAYKTPFPLGDEDFLVSARRGNKFRLYLMDVHGNRELIYEGAHHIWHAIPVRPRTPPTTHADRVAWPGVGEDRQEVLPGVLFSPDVYEGVPEIPRGMAKHLRVIQMDAKTATTWERDIAPNWFSGPVVSILQADGIKRILGTVPVEEDGSVSFEVPAGKALHFQLLDEHFRSLQTMRTFSGVMPGERRGCVGCHESHTKAPPNRMGTAQRRSPSKLNAPPWGSKTVSYERFAQPVFDQYCVDCHRDDDAAREAIDFTLRPGEGVFKEPYVSLVRGGIAGAMLVEDYDQSDPSGYGTFPPLKHLSYSSRLIEIAMGGKDHYGVEVDELSLRKLIAWVDTNCLYRGEEDMRAIPDPDFTGIDELPIRPLCKTAPEIERP